MESVNYRFNLVNYWLPQPNPCARLLLGLALLFLSSNLLSAELQYEMYIDGKLVGTSTINVSEVIYRGDAAVEIVTTSRVKVKKLKTTLFSLESEERAVIDDEGLAEYESKTSSEGENLVGSGLRMDTTLEFEMRYNGELSTYSVDRDNFDLTSEDSPVLSGIESGSPREFRVLDFDIGEVVIETYSMEGHEEVIVDGEIVPCVVYLVSRESGSYRKWYAEQFPDILVKEEGEDDSGRYTLVLKHLAEE